MSAMTVQIEMPQLSSEEEGATLATWLVSVGDHVAKGDVIAELETDKSTVELEAPASGTIAEFLVEEGTEGIAAGSVLGVLDPDDAEGRVTTDVEPTPSSESASQQAEPPESAESAAPSAAQAPLEQKPVEDHLDRRHSTPLARRAAADRHVDLNTLSGSGPGGRVLEEDVLRVAGNGADDPVAATAQPAATTEATAEPGAPAVDVSGAFSAVRLSAMRKTIARRMTEAKQQVPHFYLRMRCAMDAVVSLRAKLNQDLADEGRDVKISVNDFIVRAAALALRDVPDANVSFAGTEMHVFDQVDIAVAVATDGGLVTPVLRNADRKGLAGLAREIKELAVQARAGKLRAEQYQGGSFTISNLGMYGIETVYPILNPPQACILGVGAANQEPVVRDGEIVVGQMASLTLAADHRAVDGAVGAQLLAAIRERLEDPLGMML